MGNRRIRELYKKYPYLHIDSIWPGKKLGRHTKRRLSKARRKYAKSLLKFGRGKEPTSIESETNWKCW